MAETIEMQIGSTAYPVELLENDAARSLVSQLPLSLQFEDFGNGTERIAYLKRKLSTGSAPRSSEPVRGSLAYYAPWGNLAAFRKPFRRSEGLVPLGSLGPEAIKALERSGGAPVLLRRK